MTDNIQKENFSIAYLRAVCAKAKANFQWLEDDNDGLDCTIRKDINNHSVTLEVQLKSTTVKGVSSGFSDVGMNSFTYPLKKKNYDDLIRESVNLRLLMLLVLPENSNDWLSQDSYSLVLRKCMYYKVFSDEPKNNNSKTINIEINKQDICSEENLEKLLSDYEKELYS